MITEEKCISKLFTAIETGDTYSIMECYHDFSTIYDPIVGTIYGEVAPYYPSLLATSFLSARIEVTKLVTEKLSGFAEVKIQLTRRESNKVITCRGRLEFEFKDGKICRQVNEYNVWHLMREIDGKPGSLFGMLPSYRRKYKVKILKALNDYYAFRNSKLFGRSQAVQGRV
jgi:hypothetical protein